MLGTSIQFGPTFTVVRGTATTSETRPPAQGFPRGFILQNVSAMDSIWVRVGEGVSVDAGWEVPPGDVIQCEQCDSAELSVIAVAASVPYQIGGNAYGSPVCSVPMAAKASASIVDRTAKSTSPVTPTIASASEAAQEAPQPRRSRRR